MSISLDKKIEAVLFFRSEPIKLSKLEDLVNSDRDSLVRALEILEKRLLESALMIIMLGDEISIGTRPELSSLIENLTKEELSRDLGKAGLETISIILYKHPISRREIDFIRGVNSSFVLRNLLIRGLIKKNESRGVSRGYFYEPTIDLLSFLGLSKVDDLPQYQDVLSELDEFSKKEDRLETTE